MMAKSASVSLTSGMAMIQACPGCGRLSDQAPPRRRIGIEDSLGARRQPRESQDVGVGVHPREGQHGVAASPPARAGAYFVMGSRPCPALLAGVAAPGMG